jgi:NAD(P)-dependent dehydrogenase (short-subunit alcohol dehydrogenase family)
VSTLVQTPFGFASTAHDVIAGIDLSGRRAVVTGASSGIGVETARALFDAGADVTLAVRDGAAGARVAGEIGSGHDAARLHVARLELADLDSVQAFVGQWDGPLHILVNNAGIMAVQDRQLSPAGHELQFATNHLGHFALAVGLHDALAAGSARIVSVSSAAHFLSPLIFDDIDFAQRPYDPWRAYGQSKTANVLFAVAATAQWAGDGITANALHPGSIITNLGRNVGEVNSSPNPKTVGQGAATSVVLATSPALEGIGGRYFIDCNEVPVVASRPDDGLGVADYAVDQALAAQLWDVSIEMIGRDR